MTLMDLAQIALLIFFILLFLKPLYRHWLPRRADGFWHRLLPTRALKFEGNWQRKSANKDTKPE
jgi:hypothetical protein